VDAGLTSDAQQQWPNAVVANIEQRLAQFLLRFLTEK
jgi:hypothetical protein